MKRNIEIYYVKDEGYYYWYRDTGEMPESDPIGPFETEDEAEEAVNDDEWYSKCQFLRGRNTHIGR